MCGSGKRSKTRNGAFIQDIGDVGIGRFVQTSNTADYDPGMNPMYWESAYIIDDILAHGYLRNYTWTIDFDNMKMYLVK